MKRAILSIPVVYRLAWKTQIRPATAAAFQIVVSLVFISVSYMSQFKFFDYRLFDGGMRIMSVETVPL